MASRAHGVARWRSLLHRWRRECNCCGVARPCERRAAQKRAAKAQKRELKAWWDHLLAEVSAPSLRRSERDVTDRRRRPR